MAKEKKTDGTEKKIMPKKAEQKKETKETKESSPKTTKKAKSKSNYKIKRTAETSRLAREKSRLEKKKGKFKRQNLHKKKRVPDRWRRPKGIDSGHRIDEKHKPAHPRSGYMTPQKVKGLDVTGYKPVRVFNPAGLEGLDPKTEAIIIASAVGMKKRKDIQKAAAEKKIQVLNFKE